MDWDKLRIFHAVADAGSFTHAGDVLGLSQSAVSRQVSALEDELKTILFHRHARGLLLTEQGEMLYRTAHEVAGKVMLTEAILKDSKDKPSGELNVSAPVGLGSTWLTTRINEFLDVYPQINVNLLLDDRELDLGMREADVAIRLRAPIQPDLVQLKLFSAHYHIYGSQAYLREHGTPKTPADLDDHKIVTYGKYTELPNADPVNWLEELGRDSGDRRKPVLSINNIYGVMLAVESGLGLGSLPDYLTRDNDKLVRVLPDLDGPTYDTYFVYAEELRKSKRIGVFRDFLVRKVKEWTF